MLTVSLAYLFIKNVLPTWLSLALCRDIHPHSTRGDFARTTQMLQNPTDASLGVYNLILYSRKQEANNPKQAFNMGWASVVQ